MKSYITCFMIVSFSIIPSIFNVVNSYKYVYDVSAGIVNDKPGYFGKNNVELLKEEKLPARELIYLSNNKITGGGILSNKVEKTNLEEDFKYNQNKRHVKGNLKRQKNARELYPEGVGGMSKEELEADRIGTLLQKSKVPPFDRGQDKAVHRIYRKAYITPSVNQYHEEVITSGRKQNGEDNGRSIRRSFRVGYDVHSEQSTGESSAERTNYLSNSAARLTSVHPANSDLRFKRKLNTVGDDDKESAQQEDFMKYLFDSSPSDVLQSSLVPARRNFYTLGMYSPQEGDYRSLQMYDSPRTSRLSHSRHQNPLVDSLAPTTRKKPYRYDKTKVNYLLALRDYYKALDLYKEEPTSERLVYVRETYKAVLATFKAYRIEYQKIVNYYYGQEPFIKLPEDPSATLGISVGLLNRRSNLFSARRNENNKTDVQYYKIKMEYGKSLEDYLQQLISYYETKNNEIKKNCEIEFDRLRDTYEKYEKYFQSISLYLSEDEKRKRYRIEADPPDLMSIAQESFSEESLRLVKLYDMARIVYYKQLLKYVRAVNFYYKTNSVSGYLYATIAYKTLVAYRKLYYSVYKMLFGGQDKTKFLKYPGIFIELPENYTESGLSINLESVGENDYVYIKNVFGNNIKDYKNLVSGKSHDDSITGRLLKQTLAELWETSLVYDYFKLVLKKGPADDDLKLFDRLNWLYTRGGFERAHQLKMNTEGGVTAEDIRGVEMEFKINLLDYYALLDLVENLNKHNKQSSRVKLRLFYAMNETSFKLKYLREFCSEIRNGKIKIENPSIGKCNITPIKTALG